MGGWIAGAWRWRLNCTAIQPRIHHAVGASAVSIAVVMAGSGGMSANRDGVDGCTGARVNIRFGWTADNNASLTADVVHEIAAVWKLNDVEVVQLADGPNPDSQVTVAIVFTNALPPTATPGVLGWIKFVEVRAPLPVIYLSLPATLSILATGRFRDAPMSEVPRQVHRRLFARALGRAAAHELGHYLLGSAQHSGTGLMRVRFTVDQLIDDRRHPFRLDPVDRLALAARMREMPRACASPTTVEDQRPKTKDQRPETSCYCPRH